MIVRKRVIRHLLMTRQYPDHGTPAHFRARAASAARVASFKSPFWKVTQPRFSEGRRQPMFCVASDRGSERQRSRRKKERRGRTELQSHRHHHVAPAILIQVGWPQLSGTLITVIGWL